MTMPFRRGALAALLLGAGLSAASAAETPARPPAQARHDACFYGSQASGFAAVGDRAVNIRVGVKDVYQLTLFSPCLDIDWTQHIALRAHSGNWICEGNGLDYEIITPSPIGRQRCQVTGVRKLTPAEIAALPKRERPSSRPRSGRIDLTWTRRLNSLSLSAS